MLELSSQINCSSQKGNLTCQFCLSVDASVATVPWEGISAGVHGSSLTDPMEGGQPVLKV